MLPQSFVFLALALLVLASPTPDSESPDIVIPITKDVDAVKLAINAMTGYRNNTDVTANLAKHVRSATVPLNAYSGILWFTTVIINPYLGQEFRVAISTIHSYTLLPSQACETNCAGHTRYIPSNLAQGPEPATGSLSDKSVIDGKRFVIYKDRVLLHNGVIVVPDLEFGVALEYPDELSIEYFTPDGLLGLGPSHGPQMQSIIMRIFDNKNFVLNSETVAFKLKKTDEGDAHINIGLVRKSHFMAPMQFVTVPEDRENWELDLLRILVNGQEVIPAAGPERSAAPRRARTGVRERKPAASGMTHRDLLSNRSSELRSDGWSARSSKIMTKALVMISQHREAP